MAPISSKLAGFFRTRTPQEKVLYSFFLIMVIGRMIKMLRRKTLKFSEPHPARVGSDSGSEAEVLVRKGNKIFTQTKEDPCGLGWSAAAPYYLFPVLACMEVVMQLKHPGRAWAKGAPTVAQKLMGELYLFFGIVPLLECFVAHDWSNLSDEQQRKHPARDFKFRMPLFLFSFCEIALTYIMLAKACDMKNPLRIRDRIAMCILNGLINGGIGITYSHELIHKDDKPGILAGHALLVNCTYTHWHYEHLYGHHKHVATPKDPATAQKGETFYQFFPKTVLGTIRSSWEIEKERLEKQGRSGDMWWLTPHNRVLSGFGASVAWACSIAAMSGTSVKRMLPAFALQSVAAFSLLEAVNYVEHYGLARKLLPNGNYEPVDPTHSWNSPHWLSNTLLVKLQRHSDHHSFAKRPYEVLRNFKESPQLPTGYPGMVALAMVPQAFRWVMDPLTDAYNSGDRDAAEKAQQDAERRIKITSGAGFAALTAATVFAYRGGGVQ